MSSAGEFFSTTASEGCSVITGGLPKCFKTEKVQNMYDTLIKSISSRWWDIRGHSEIAQGTGASFKF